MAEVLLKDVVKNYGKTEVVHGVDLSISDSEFVVFVGPSGCGKSTILRMVAGLEEISGGTISIAGKVVNDVAPKDRSVAMVFQNYALYPHMNVFDNMSFGLRIKKTPKEEIQQRVTEAARILGLEEYLMRKPNELSGGQRQRVAMGRAIVRNPAIFLFDEPLSNLDAKLRTQMRIEIKRLHQRVRSTIIYVTHDQVEAMTLGDRIVVLKDGYIEQVGTPIELFQNPVNTFVAGFIGSPPMNLVDGIVEQGKSGLAISFPGGMKIPVPEKPGASVTAGQEVVMGLRTEDLNLDDGTETFPEAWKVSAIIDVVEPLGNETHLHIDMDGVKLIARCDGRMVIHPGEKIRIALNLEHLHVFDANSRKSIY